MAGACGGWENISGTRNWGIGLRVSLSSGAMLAWRRWKGMRRSGIERRGRLRLGLDGLGLRGRWGRGWALEATGDWA